MYKCVSASAADMCKEVAGHIAERTNGTQRLRVQSGLGIKYIHSSAGELISGPGAVNLSLHPKIPGCQHQQFCAVTEFLAKPFIPSCVMAPPKTYVCAEKVRQKTAIQDVLPSPSNGREVQQKAVDREGMPLVKLPTHLLCCATWMAFAVTAANAAAFLVHNTHYL